MVFPDGEKDKMNVQVFYFSGTGNSLDVAKEIAAGVEGEICAMAKSGKTTKTDATKVGLVFPSYMAQLHGIPLIVERFTRGLEDIGSKYIFAVCTCGGYENFNALPTLRNLSRLVRSLGGRVAAEYSIRLPMNTLDYSHIPLPIDQDKERMFEKCHGQVRTICETVTRGGTSRYKVSKALLNWTMAPLYLLLRGVYYRELLKNAREPRDCGLSFYELIPMSDKSISINENCKSCSTCVKVCPVGNITMLNGKPTWQHHCEICLACAEWCPNGAIHHNSRPQGKNYHHPKVSLDDMLAQANR